MSGEALAHTLKVTRTAVWKQIHALKNAGFPIRTRPRQGYVLDGVPDFSLAALTFSGELAAWAHPHYALVAPSTQVQAKRAAVSGVPEGHFWIAELQTQGRGRLERAWSSGFGGLWFSLVLRPQVPPSRVATIGLIAALELSRTIEHCTGLRAALKWPNDVLIAQGPHGEWKKAAGLLTEMSGEMDKTDWIVLGIGLNVFNGLPKNLQAKAAALAPTPGPKTRSFSRKDLITDFLRRFYPAYRQWQRKGFAAFQSDYWERYARPNQPCVLKTAQGELRGIARSVDVSGAIILESRRKTQAVLEGEIVL